MKKGLLLIISIIIGILIYQKNDDVIIPSDSIRVRIIANSDNISDLYEKKKIKNEIKNQLYDLVKSVDNYKEAKNLIINNIDEIERIVADKTTDFKIDFGSNYFPRKIYKGVIYNEGEYESLVITLGKGLGENWWCVLYPPLCLLEDNENTKDVEYKLAIQKLLSN